MNLKGCWKKIEREGKTNLIPVEHSSMSQQAKTFHVLILTEDPQKYLNQNLITVKMEA